MEPGTGERGNAQREREEGAKGKMEEGKAETAKEKTEGRRAKTAEEKTEGGRAETAEEKTEKGRAETAEEKTEGGRAEAAEEKAEEERAEKAGEKTGAEEQRGIFRRVWTGRGLSIKARVTLWYTFFMVLLLGVAAVYIFSSSRRVSGRQMREQLVDVVTDSVQNVRFRYGKLDAEELDFYRNGVSIFIYDTGGRLLAPNVNRGLQVDSLLEDQEIKTAYNSGDRWMIYDVYSEREGNGFWVRGMISMTEYGQALGNLPLLFFSMLPLFVAVAALGGYRITKRAFFPVRQIAETAEAIGSGSDLSQRIETDGSGDELNRLGNTMNGMLSRLQASFEAERQFSSDVSHELRTPIAVIRSQCEFALSGHAGEEDKREALCSVLAQSERMNAIVSQLLLLSRAENGKFVPEKELVELGTLCEFICEDLTAQAEEKGVSLTWETGEVSVIGDETLLIRMVTNLVTNAIRYNREGGSVHVILRADGEKAILTVRDTGIGIKSEDLGRIFNRFYRADASRRTEGTGLGLSMAKWIASVHGGTIRAESVYGVGSAFIVELPGAGEGKKGELPGSGHGEAQG